jgi:hypothetical protein
MSHPLRRPDLQYELYARELAKLADVTPSFSTR